MPWNMQKEALNLKPTLSIASKDETQWPSYHSFTRSMTQLGKYRIAFGYLGIPLCLPGPV